MLNKFCGLKEVENHVYQQLISTLVAGDSRLWGSKRMERNYQRYKNEEIKFQALVEAIRGNKDKKPRELFEIGMEHVRKIPGMNVNMLTELMITYDPYKYAILNRASHKPLLSLNARFLKRNTGGFDGEDYDYFCRLIMHIRQSFGLKDMLEADSLLESYYKYIKP